MKIIKILLVISILGNIYLAYKASDYRAHVNFYLDKYRAAVDEMARREDYSDDNVAVQSDSTVNGRIVFFGTQLIADWPLAEYFAEYEPINRGVIGQRAAGLLLRYYPDVIELSPEYALIQISSYNFRHQNRLEDLFNYAVQMYDMAECHNIVPIATTVAASSDTRLIVESDVAEGKYHIRDSIMKVNEMIRDYTESKNIPLADFDSILSDSKGSMNPELTGGVLIPNDSGYRLLSENVREIIRKNRSTD